MFITYPKIHRLGKEETIGLLEFGDVTVQEKIDGANTSIWLEDGVLCGGSRTRQLGDESFNGFVGYMKTHPGIMALLTDNPDYRLFGEWLVRHTIAYKETAYRQWYMFDIMVGDKFLHQRDVIMLAANYGLLTPNIFGEGRFTVEQLSEFVGRSVLGDKGEGVVIKNESFVNQFGDFCYAKVVTEKFKEDNAITFGGNNKHSDTYWEMYVVNKYCTLARVQKIMNKIQPEINKKLDKEHTPRIIQTCYHDLITEEAWEIQGRVEALNFRTLKALCNRKFVKIYHDILDDHISVAYQEAT
jgi:hypothetical protein